MLQGFQIASVDEDALIRGTADETVLNSATSMDELRPIPLLTVEAPGFSAAELRRSASQGKPGESMAIVDSQHVEIALRMVPQPILDEVAKMVRVAGTELDRTRGWIKHARFPQTTGRDHGAITHRC